MTAPVSDLETVHPHRAIWWRVGSGSGLLGIALGTIAGTVSAASSSHTSLANFWMSDPMCFAYVLVTFAVIFFILGLVGCPFPLGDGIKPRRRHQKDAEAAIPHGTASAARPFAVAGLSERPLPRGQGRVQPDGVATLPARSPMKHRWCAKCGFPFQKPQSRATCEVDRPGGIWCERRRRKPKAERLRLMIENPNTLYRVHPEWQPNLVPDPEDAAE